MRREIELGCVVEADGLIWTGATMRPFQLRPRLIRGTPSCRTLLRWRRWAARSRLLRLSHKQMARGRSNLADGSKPAVRVANI